MCHWKPFWVHDGDGDRKASFEEVEQVALVLPPHNLLAMLITVYL